MTIREVAEKAGVSTATVSRMINENGFVSDEAKERIQQAIKETGYNPTLRKRRQGNGDTPLLKHRNVAMIWTDGTHSKLSNAGQDMMMGISEALRRMGASLTVDHVDSSKHIPPALLQRKLDGILIHGQTPAPAVCEQLRKLPVVWLLQAGSTEFGDRVQPDHAFTGELSCNYFLEQGCRNVCCMSYTPTSGHFEYWKTRTDSFLNHATHNGIQANLLVHPESTNPGNRQSDMAAAASSLVDAFAHLNPRPDGLLVANDLGVYVHGELLRRGIVPMKDVILIAGDANICVQHMDPEPIKIRIFGQHIGRQAVDMLLLRIKNHDMPQTTCFLKPQLVMPVKSIG